jgi:HSP20 family molecular chaperone IbpA
VAGRRPWGLDHGPCSALPVRQAAPSATRSSTSPKEMVHMMLRLRDPFADSVSLRQAMDRLVEQSLPRPNRGWLAVDVSETPTELVIKTALPGVRPEDVDITIEGDILTITGEHKAHEETQDTSPPMRRYPQRGFSRASRRISATGAGSMGGRPQPRRGSVQRRATNRRCQRSRVSGVMKKLAQRPRGSPRSARRGRSGRHRPVRVGPPAAAGSLARGAARRSRRPWSAPSGSAAPPVRAGAGSGCTAALATRGCARLG